MKANACMLLRVMCERCIGLCLKDDLKMKIIGTSCILCVHIYWDTSPVMMMSADAHNKMIRVFIGSMTLWGSANIRTRYKLAWPKRVQEVCKPPVDSHSHMWVVCREILHIQFVRDRRPPLWWFLNNRSLNHELHVFAFPYPNSGSLTETRGHVLLLFR